MSFLHWVFWIFYYFSVCLDLLLENLLSTLCLYMCKSFQLFFMCTIYVLWAPCYRVRVLCLYIFCVYKKYYVRVLNLNQLWRKANLQCRLAIKYSILLVLDNWVLVLEQYASLLWNTRKIVVRHCEISQHRTMCQVGRYSYTRIITVTTENVLNISTLKKMVIFINVTMSYFKLLNSSK